MSEQVAPVSIYENLLKALTSGKVYICDESAEALLDDLADRFCPDDLFNVAVPNCCQLDMDCVTHGRLFFDEMAKQHFGDEPYTKAQLVVYVLSNALSKPESPIYSNRNKVLYCVSSALCPSALGLKISDSMCGPIPGNTHLDDFEKAKGEKDELRACSDCWKYALSEMKGDNENEHCNS